MLNKIHWILLELINSLSSGQFLFYVKDPISVACDQRKWDFFFKVKFILFSRFSIADRLSREHFGLGSSKNQLCHEKGFGPLPKTDDFRKDQSTKKVEFLYEPTVLQWDENILKIHQCYHKVFLIKLLKFWYFEKAAKIRDKILRF